MKASHLIVSVTACICGIAYGSEVDCSSARQTLSEIDRAGAQVVLSKAYENRGQWNCLIKGIESASPAWLTVASKLRSASDAGSTSEINAAVVKAFERQPKNVLLAANDKSGAGRLSLKDVCAPSIEPAQGYEKFYAATESRLQKLRNPSLRTKIKSCLSSVAEARSSLSIAPK